MPSLDFKNLASKITVFKRIPWFLAKYEFLVILFLILLAMILGVFLFQNYVILIEKKEVEVNNSSIKFKDNVYQKIISQWQIDEEKLRKLEIKNYVNPFN